MPLPLPRYSPELNPAEQVFRVLRPKLANRIFGTIDELEAALTAHLRPYWDQPALVQRLTGYPWWTTPSPPCHRLRERVLLSASSRSMASRACCTPAGVGFPTEDVLIAAHVAGTVRTPVDGRDQTLEIAPLEANAAPPETVGGNVASGIQRWIVQGVW